MNEIYAAFCDEVGMYIDAPVDNGVPLNTDNVTGSTDNKVKVASKSSKARKIATITAVTTTAGLIADQLGWSWIKPVLNLVASLAPGFF